MNYNRRTFLTLAAAAGVGGPLLLAEACGPAPVSPVPATAPVPTISATTAVPPTAAARPGPTSPAATKLQLPTYIPAQAAKPDLPGSAAGLDPAYFTYPKDHVKSVTEVPGRGGDVTALAVLQIAPP